MACPGKCKGRTKRGYECVKDLSANGGSGKDDSTRGLRKPPIHRPPCMWRDASHLVKCLHPAGLRIGATLKKQMGYLPHRCGMDTGKHADISEWGDVISAHSQHSFRQAMVLRVGKEVWEKKSQGGPARLWNIRAGRLMEREAKSSPRTRRPPRRIRIPTEGAGPELSSRCSLHFFDISGLPLTHGGSTLRCAKVRRCTFGALKS
jgi:hypothetical protein